MSSEAAYFPDVIATSSEADEFVRGVSGLEPGATHCDAASRPLCVAQPPEMSDELLMEQVLEGTREALALLFRRHALRVRNVAYRILRNEAEAEDLVQDVFIFIFRKAALFDATHGSARSWIVHITYHRAFDRRRYLITRHFYADQDPEDALSHVADRHSKTFLHEWSFEGVWGKASAARLRELLSPDQLATIQLHFFEGFTLEEVAERLEQSIGKVRHHYYRGLEKLRMPAFARKLRSK
jgi:RNA polymerase sigma-70 factor (ECF subfamily)